MTWIGIALVFIFWVGLKIYLKKKRIGVLYDLRTEYDEALKGNDKVKASETGRRYYTAIGNGTFNAYAEQTMANEIAAMMPRSDK